MQKQHRTRATVSEESKEIETKLNEHIIKLIDLNPFEVPHSYMHTYIHMHMWSVCYQLNLLSPLPKDTRRPIFNLNQFLFTYYQIGARLQIILTFFVENSSSAKGSYDAYSPLLIINLRIRSAFRLLFFGFCFVLIHSIWFSFFDMISRHGTTLRLWKNNMILLFRALKNGFRHFTTTTFIHYIRSRHKYLFPKINDPVAIQW